MIQLRFETTEKILFQGNIFLFQHSMGQQINGSKLPWHIIAASWRWLHVYPTIPLWGHSNTLSSSPVQFRSLI